MKVSATEVKTRFGEFMNKSRREPVTIEKAGRSYAVLISNEEYQRLLAAEEAFWVARADQAAKSGFIGTEEAAKLSKDI